MHSGMRNAQAGFSLLEMLVAVGILSAAAYVALDTVDQDVGQRRYELTEMRLTKIRRAIVGDPDLVLNGSPVVSGYVADVGALPRCLDALLTADPDCNGNGVEDSNVAETIQYPALDQYTNLGNSGLMRGWRGPYVSGGLSGLPDAWGNTEIEGSGNWGYNVQLVDEDDDIYLDENDGPEVNEAAYVPVGTSTAMVASDVFVKFGLRSLGMDREVGNAGDTYVRDKYMSDANFTLDDDTTTTDDTLYYSVSAQDYSVDLSGQIEILVTNTATGVDKEICVAMIVPGSGHSDGWDLLVSSGGPETIANGAIDEPISFSTSSRIVMGGYRFIVYDADISHTPASDCKPASDADYDSLIAESVALTGDTAASDYTGLFLRKPLIVAPRTPLNLSYSINLL